MTDDFITSAPAAAARPQRATIALAYPFEHGGVTYREVTMRRAKGKDLRRIEAAGDGLGASLIMVSALCDLPPEAVDEMDAEDVTALVERAADFLPNAGQTGAA